jgi:hypothetical protein
MARATRKPVLRKYPKTPKRGATLATMNRYKERCREVDRHNNAKVSEYNKKIDDIRKARKMHEELSGTGRKSKKVYKFHTL